MKDTWIRTGKGSATPVTPEELAALGYTCIEEVGEITPDQFQQIWNRLASTKKMVPTTERMNF